jgi:hypothetical protein
VGAFELHLEQGQTASFIASPEYQVPGQYDGISLRYGDQVYIEGLQAGWDEGRITGISLGVRSSEKWFAEASIGIGNVISETELLDGNKQFILSAGIGYKYESLIISLKYRHLSNANTKGNNYGVDISMLSIGVEF